MTMLRHDYVATATGACDTCRRAETSAIHRRNRKMPKPICVSCQRFYRPSRNSVRFIESMPIKNGARPGTEEPDAWQPYKLWYGDEWQCQGCGQKIIVGHGLRPVAVRHHDGFAAAIAGVRVRVNDC